MSRAFEYRERAGAWWWAAPLVCLGVGGCGGATSEGSPLKEALFVAVGGEGAILTSSDAASWTAQVSGTRAMLNGVAASDTRFVVVGESGTILTSHNGKAWTARDSGTEVDLNSVLFDDQQFVAVGGGYADQAVVLTSADGVSWNRLEVLQQYSFQTVATARATILAAAVTPSKDLPMALDRVVLASVPPSQSNRGGWVVRDVPSFNDAMRWGGQADGETFLVGSWTGESWLSRSRDGERWSTEALPLPSVSAIAAAPDGSTFVILGSRSSLASRDATEWTESALPITTGEWPMAVAYGAGTFVSVGLHGTLLTSPDGSGWSSQRSGVTTALLDITFGPLGL